MFRLILNKFKTKHFLYILSYDKLMVG